MNLATKSNNFKIDINIYLCSVKSISEWDQNIGIVLLKDNNCNSVPLFTFLHKNKKWIHLREYF
jgi:hypothetical protein